MSRNERAHLENSRIWSLVLGAMICCAPGFANYLTLRDYVIHDDDYLLIDRSRDWKSTQENLFVPHHAHFSPVFRLIVFPVVKGAGNWSSLPTTITVCNYLSVLLLMLTGGIFVGRATNSQIAGFCTMILLGNTSVYFNGLNSFAGSQTTWSAVFICLMLWTLQLYMESQNNIWILFAVACSLLAAGSWTGGFAAFPVAAAFLLCQSQSRLRWLAGGMICLGAMLCASVLIWKGSDQFGAINFGRPAQEAVNPWLGAVLAFRAISEVIVLENLGVVVTLSPAQGFLLSLGMVLLVWSFWPEDCGLRAVIAAGAMVMAVSLWIVCTFRSYTPLSGIRELSHYLTIPQTGFAICIVGLFCSMLRLRSRSRLHFPNAKYVLVTAFLFAVYFLQHPRTESHMMLCCAEAGSENKLLPVSELRQLYLRSVISIRRADQKLFLSHLDDVEAMGLKISTVDLGESRTILGLVGPGVPNKLFVCKANQSEPLTDHDRMRWQARLKTMGASYQAGRRQLQEGFRIFESPAPNSK